VIGVVKYVLVTIASLVIVVVGVPTLAIMGRMSLKSKEDQDHDQYP